MNGSRNPYQRDGGVTGRAIFALLLCFIVPPIGLMYIWRLGVFQLRGRVLLTVLAGLELMLMFAGGLFGLVDWNSIPSTVEPVPGSALAVTAQPDDATLNALSNIDELVAQGVSDNPEETLSPDATPILTQEEQLAQQQEVLNTTVYAVYSGAKYYHVSTVCGNQSNGRALTVEEALAEGMGACPNCDPPVP